MTRVRLLVALVALCALAAACGVASGGGPHVIPKNQVLFHLLTKEPPSTTTTTTPAVDTVPVTVWLVSPAQKYLVPVPRTVARTATLATVIDTLLAGPTSFEVTKGITTALNAGVVLLRVKVRSSAGVAVLDFNPAFGEISGTLQVQAVAQLVFTVTGVLGKDYGVQFELDGTPTAVPTDTGAQVSGPVHLLQYVTLYTPADTATGSSPTTTVPG